MKTVLKLFVVGLVAMTLSFSPALMSLAMAGGINYEGFSGYRTDNSWGYEEGQTRGIKFNFSFGGPENYKKGSSIQDVYKQALTTNQKTGIVVGAIGVAILLLVLDDDDDDCNDSYKLSVFDPCDRPRLEIE